MSERRRSPSRYPSVTSNNEYSQPAESYYLDNAPPRADRNAPPRDDRYLDRNAPPRDDRYLDRNAPPRDDRYLDRNAPARDDRYLDRNAPARNSSYSGSYEPNVDSYSDRHTQPMNSRYSNEYDSPLDSGYRDPHSRDNRRDQKIHRPSPNPEHRYKDNLCSSYEVRGASESTEKSDSYHSYSGSRDYGPPTVSDFIGPRDHTYARDSHSNPIPPRPSVNPENQYKDNRYSDYEVRDTQNINQLSKTYENYQSNHDRRDYSQPPSSDFNGRRDDSRWNGKNWQGKQHYKDYQEIYNSSKPTAQYDEHSRIHRRASPPRLQPPNIMDLPIAEPVRDNYQNARRESDFRSRSFNHGHTNYDYHQNSKDYKNQMIPPYSQPSKTDLSSLLDPEEIGKLVLEEVTKELGKFNLENSLATNSSVEEKRANNYGKKAYSATNRNTNEQHQRQYQQGKNVSTNSQQQWRRSQPYQKHNFNRQQQQRNWNSRTVNRNPETGTSTSKDGAEKVNEPKSKPHIVLEKDINILILGETGVGKSTWINGFVNYLSYSTMEEAEVGENVSLIKSTFTMTDEKFQQVTVTTLAAGTSAVSESKGQSDTQCATTYRIPKGSATVCLIDTPGIGDTRGIEKDNENFQNILDHLLDYKEIHGVCILLKPNNARLTVMFRFCILELLKHLHKDASRNIIFCFTNSRGTFYRPGDTMPPLEEMVKKVQKDVDIPLRKDNIFCMDNESVRFLAAVKQEIKFSDDERKNYCVSWEKSFNETSRLVTYVSTLNPHNIKDTLSLNNARQMIMQLSKPLAEIQLNIQVNISLQNQLRNEIDTANTVQDQLRRSLVYQHLDIEAKQIEYPRTVCSSITCVEVVPVKGNLSKTNYVKHCHEKCSLKGVDVERIGHPQLQKCVAMRTLTRTCIVCGCNWQSHLHIMYETTKVFRNEINNQVQIKLQGKSVAIKMIKDRKAAIEEEVKTQKEEQQYISKVSAQLAHFLNVNSITPFNDAMEDYLNHLIHQEEEKPHEFRDHGVIFGLKSNLAAYKEEVKILEAAFARKFGINNKEPLSLSDISNLVQSLYALKLNGRNIKQIMAVSKIARSQYSKQNEITSNSGQANSLFNKIPFVKQTISFFTK